MCGFKKQKKALTFYSQSLICHCNALVLLSFIITALSNLSIVQLLFVFLQYVLRCTYFSEVIHDKVTVRLTDWVIAQDALEIAVGYLRPASINGLDSKEVLTMPRSCSNMDSGCRFFGVNALEDFKNNCICKK